MREKAIKNYYMIIGSIAIDVIRKDGASYIKVVDTKTGNKRMLFTMDLYIVSSNVEPVTIEKVRNILRRNIELLRDREVDLITYRK